MRTGTESRGFTLIELMVVVAIIGILAAIALPAYRQYLTTSANNACLAEAKAYMTTAVADLASWQDAKDFIPGACVSISATPTMADFTGSGAASIDFTVKAPGERDTRCNPGTAECVLI